MAYRTKDGIVMLGASNLRQQKRLWTVLERPDMIKRTNDERHADHDREEQVLAEIMLTRTATEWESWLQDRHVPASNDGGRIGSALPQERGGKYQTHPHTASEIPA